MKSGSFSSYQAALSGTGADIGGERDDDEPHRNCERCNAGMPSHRVNPLCEECFAEESDEYDSEAEQD